MAEVFLLWLGLSVAVGIFAARMGRSGSGWTLLSALISPLLAAILLALLGRHAPPEPERRPCPYCQEPVMPLAIKCKHCGSQIEASQ